MFRRLIAVIIVVVLLTGCAYGNDNVIDELAIILAMAFDSDPGDENLVYFTTSNPLFAEEAVDPVRIMTVQGHGVAGALDNWQKHRNRIISLGKVKVTLFGETISQQRLSQKVQDIRQIPEVDANSLVAYHPGKAQDVLYQNPVEDGRVAVFLNDMLDFAADQGLVPRVTLHDLWTHILTEGRDGYLPMIELEEEGDSSLYISGMAVLNEEGNVATTLNDNEAKLLTNMLFRKTTPVFTTNVVVENKEGLMIYGVQNSSEEIIVDYDSEEISINIENDVTIHIKEIQIPQLEFVTQENFETIAQDVAKDFVNNTQALLDKLQEHESDPLGLGRHVRIQQKDYYSQGTWREDYPDIDIANDYTVNVVRGNTVLETFETDQ